MKTTGTLYRLLTTVAFAGLLATPAFAQNDRNRNPARAAADHPGEEEEIVVTGERNNQFGTDVVQAGSFRGAKALDTPLTVSVIPAAVLRSQQAIDLIDALRNTAGVSTTAVSPVAYNNVTVRGITVDTRSNFKLDGSLNILSSIAFPLEDKDRVEVLKGASALYYGFSTPAGIVNLTMKRPTREFSFFENTFFDSNGGIGEHVDVSDTFGPFGVRLNGVYAHIDTGIDLVTGRRYLAAGAVDIKPTRKLTITGDIEYFGRRITEPAVFRLTVPASVGLGPVQLPNLKLLDPTVNFAGATWAQNDTTELNYLGKAIYKFSRDWNLSGYYGMSRLVRIRNNPQFTPTNLTTALTTGAGTVSFAAQNTLFKNVNYAAELAGTLRFGNIRNEMLFGASRGIKLLSSPSPVRTTRAQNFLTPVIIPNPNLVFAPRPTPTRIDDKGFYFFDRLSFNDIVQLLGGVRKTDYTDNGTLNSVSKTPFHAKPWSFSGGVVIKPAKWASLYGTYIEGLEVTAAAPIADENATETFPPTSSTQYEAGLKLEPHKDLLFQAAYFDIHRGAAFEALNPATNKLHFYTSGRTRYRGLELSLTGNVLPDLALSASATFLKAKYQGTHTSPSIDGLRVEGTPNQTMSLAGEYRVSWIDPGLKLTAGVYHVGTQAINANNNAFTPAYTTFDVGASYTFLIRGHQLIARVNGQNITGKRYWAATGASTLAENLPSVVKFSLGFNY
jgi:iron complex outermembrane receptor protein